MNLRKTLVAFLSLLFCADLLAGPQDYSFYYEEDNNPHFTGRFDSPQTAFNFIKIRNYRINDLIIFVETIHANDPVIYHVHVTTDGRLRWVHAEGRTYGNIPGSNSDRDALFGVERNGTDALLCVDPVTLAQSNELRDFPRTRNFLYWLQLVINQHMGPDAYHPLPVEATEEQKENDSRNGNKEETSSNDNKEKTSEASQERKSKRKLTEIEEKDDEEKETKHKKLLEREKELRERCIQSMMKNRMNLPKMKLPDLSAINPKNPLHAYSAHFKGSN
jgi:hypothetical protein